ncbi:hypothetical protein L1085_000410 [Streptomyces sp. MSC1_001]|jgi:hypothetical protein|uniref:hypothetical protein n=1 Tax=Streptomyces sp. MSC1_001 TaxID=2909263 RepID=UPI002030D42D|nr:hypothetical protein [Streptomyces sp. MSC1_001]
MPALVHVRQAVGQVYYRICTDCAQGVITALTLDERFLGQRAGHPGAQFAKFTLEADARRRLLERPQPAPSTGTDADQHQRPDPGPGQNRGTTPGR